MFKEKNFDGNGRPKGSQPDADEEKRAEDFFEMMANYSPPSYDHDEWYVQEILPLMEQVAKKMTEKNVPFYMATLTAHNREDKSGRWRVNRSAYFDKAALGEDGWMPPQIIVFAVGIENSVREMISAAQHLVEHAVKKAIPHLFEKLFGGVSQTPPQEGEDNNEPQKLV